MTTTYKHLCALIEIAAGLAVLGSIIVLCAIGAVEPTWQCLFGASPDRECVVLVVFMTGAVFFIVGSPTFIVGLFIAEAGLRIAGLDMVPDKRLANKTV
jgi:hypothetical protein